MGATSLFEMDVLNFKATYLYLGIYSLFWGMSVLTPTRITKNVCPLLLAWPFFWEKKWEDKSFLWATDTPALDFWWCLPWVSKLWWIPCRLCHLSDPQIHRHLLTEWRSNFWRTWVLLWSHWHPCFALLVTSVLDSSLVRHLLTFSSWQLTPLPTYFSK